MSITNTFSVVCVYAPPPQPTQQLEPSVHSWVPQFFGFCPVLHAIRFISFNSRLNNDFYCRQWFGSRKLNQRYVVKNKKDRKEIVVGVGGGLPGPARWPCGGTREGVFSMKAGNLGSVPGTQLRWKGGTNSTDCPLTSRCVPTWNTSWTHMCNNKNVKYF